MLPLARKSISKCRCSSIPVAPDPGMIYFISSSICSGRNPRLSGVLVGSEILGRSGNFLASDCGYSRRLGFVHEGLGNLERLDFCSGQWPKFLIRVEFLCQIRLSPGLIPKVEIEGLVGVYDCNLTIFSDQNPGVRCAFDPVYPHCRPATSCWSIIPSSMSSSSPLASSRTRSLYASKLFY